MTDITVLVERYQLVEEISRDESTVTYKAFDLRLGNSEIQLVLLTNTDPDVAKQFYRSAKQGAVKIPTKGEFALRDLACTEKGNFFAVYGRCPEEKAKNIIEPAD